MGKLLMIAKTNMRQKKGDIIVLTLLITLASTLFYVALHTVTQMSQTLDNAYETHHSADYLFVTNPRNSYLDSMCRKLTGVTEYEENTALIVNATYGKTTPQGDPFEFIFSTIEDEHTLTWDTEKTEHRTINTLPELNGKSVQKDDIYLPYYLSASSGLKKGDSIVLRFSDREFSFHIAGFVSDPLFNTPLNYSGYHCYISTEMWNQIYTDTSLSDLLVKSIYKIKIEPEKFESTRTEIYDGIRNHTDDFPDGITFFSWRDMRSGAAIMPMIFMALVLIFCFLILVIVTVVMRFVIRNYVELNMKNIGILEAGGYRAKELRLAAILEMSIVALAGIFLSFIIVLFFHRINTKIFGILLGLYFHQLFDVKVGLITLCFIFGVVVSVSFFCTRVYQKTTVLHALRGGIDTHNFRRNHFPILSSRLPLSLNLALKNIFGERGKTASIFIISFILAMASTICGGLYESYVKRDDILITFSGIESGDFYMFTNNSKRTTIFDARSEVMKWDEVEKTALYMSTTLPVTFREHTVNLNAEFIDSPSALEHILLLRGKLPTQDNEIVLTVNMAQALGADIGDTVYVEGLENRCDFIVCGINQQIQNLGQCAKFTWSANLRLNGEQLNTDGLYVYLKDGTDRTSLMKRAEDELSEYQPVIVDSSKINSVLSIIKTVITAVTLVFVIITIIIVFLVELLLTKSKMIREQQNLAIQKSLGYTTKELKRQIILMNIPSIFTGAVLGTVVSFFTASKLTATLVKAFLNIEKLPITIPVSWAVGVVALMILVALCTSCLCAHELNKMNVVEML